MAKKTTFKSGGQKDTEGKPRFDLIPPEADLAYAEVLTLGANKYYDRNWEKGIPYMACIGALKRHLNKIEMGEDLNLDDGDLTHYHALVFWAGALMTFHMRGREDLDDRPSKGQD